LAEGETAPRAVRTKEVARNHGKKRVFHTVKLPHKTGLEERMFACGQRRRRSAIGAVRVRVRRRGLRCCDNVLKTQ
jgi:ribosomal protein L1